MVVTLLLLLLNMLFFFSRLARPSFPFQLFVPHVSVRVKFHKSNDAVCLLANKSLATVVTRLDDGQC